MKGKTMRLSTFYAVQYERDQSKANSLFNIIYIYIYSKILVCLLENLNFVIYSGNLLKNYFMLAMTNFKLKGQMIFGQSYQTKIINF